MMKNTEASVEFLVSLQPKFKSIRLEQMFAYDTWLRNKLDRERRIKDHIAYINNFAPEFWDMQPSLVIDYGCADGVMLEIARSIGHGILGIESPSGSDAMGNDYWTAAKILAQMRSIPVDYCGVLQWIKEPTVSPEQACFINCRGAIEQIMHVQMNGTPSHIDHSWRARLWKDRDMLRIALESFLAKTCVILKGGGVLLVHSNNAANGEVFEKTCEEIAKTMTESLRYEHPKERVHKWTRVGV